FVVGGPVGDSELLLCHGMVCVVGRMRDLILQLSKSSIYSTKPRRSIAETAMYRVKQLFGGSLTLRDYDGQVAEAMALVRALNKMTKAGMPESVRIA
ncbi:hypothetical protein RUW58_27175, partial [Klebsiella pneumoniae]|nr:hypothetical protein [Klebsiella pneumoniae]